MTFKFQIKARFTGAVIFEADLDDLHESQPDSVKLGEAVKAALMVNANLVGANLVCANLRDANLEGADLGEDFKINSLIARVTRLIDPYEFFAFDTNRGVVIKAGCRLMTPSDYRVHVGKEYPDTDKAAETIAILDFIEKRAAILKGAGQ